MAQIFVSHSSADNDLALLVRSCLGDLGYDSVFLDVSPTDGLVPGAAWRDQLFSNLDRSDALVLVGTPAANASQWCHSELALARWLRKPILSLLFDHVEPHELVADIQGIALASADLSPELIRPGLVALGLEQAERWDATRSPFPGLRPFDESYAPVFFGRERQVDQLRQLVDPPGRARQGVVVPVLGPSGSGKSSLVRAGLVAALRPAPDWVVSDPWTPSDAPLAELALALAHAAKRHEVALDADECRELLSTPGGMSEYLRRLRATGDLPAEARVLVVVDQAEELVTLTAEAERQAFLEALALGCTPPSPLRVVMTARTDMWDSVSALTNRFETTVATAVLHVPPLSRADLARVVAEPAKRSHLVLEEGLVQRLVEDTETGDALPLLAYTLQRMTALARDGQLTHALYDGVGGVRGAIASRAAEVAHGARSQAEVAAAILQLVGTSEGRPVTRLAPVDTVPAAQREMLDDLVDARLVVVRESAGHQVYAPAHEALFSAWPPLAEMISTRSDDLRLRSRLERRAADWREAGAGASGLLSGEELAQAAAWEERNPDLRTPDVTAYVTASAGRARRNRLLRLGTAAVVAGLALALVAVVLVNAANDRSQARQARVGELAAIAERELVHDPAAAAAALLQGLSLDAGSDTLAASARKLLRSPARDVAAVPDDVPVLALQAGRRLAVSNGNGEHLVWDTATGRLRGRIPTAGAVVAVRPDDRVAVVSSGTDGMSFWDLAGDEPTQLSVVPRSPNVARFSPDGSLLATVVGAVVTLYDVADPESPTELASWHTQGSTVNDVAVLDDGRVLSSGDDALVSDWRPLTGDPSRALVSDPPAAGVSPNRLLVDESAEHALISVAAIGQGASLYDLDTGKPVHTYLPAPAGSGLADAASTWVASTDRSMSWVTVFDLAGRGYVFHTDDDKTPYVQLVGGHTATVALATVTGDGLLVTGAIDGTVRMWDTTAPQRDVPADLREALCEQFGARIDDQSRTLALGEEELDEPCASKSAKQEPAALAIEGTAHPGAPVESVASDDFADGYSLFTQGTFTVAEGVSLTRTIQGGVMLVASQGGGEDYSTWSQVPLGLTPASYQVGVTVVGNTSGRCGLTVSDGSTRVNVVISTSTRRASATWFVDGRYDRRRDFDIPAAASPVLVARRDDDGLTITMDGREVQRFAQPGLGAAADAGVATLGNENGCAFDDFAVSLP